MSESGQPPPYDPRDDVLSRTTARARTDIERCGADPWYAIQQGWVLTFDETPGEGVKSIRPLEPLDYLRAITRLWQESQRGILFKSRQLRISWLFSWLELWDARFHANRHAVFQGKRLEDVDAGNPHRILGRARFIREHLPLFLQPNVVTQNQTSETYDNGSTIEAIPEGADIVRGRVPSSMAMDEGAFQETAEQNWDAALASAGKLWMISTPNGHEFGYRQSEPGRPWDDLTGGKPGRWPEVLPGLWSYRNSKDVQLVGLHYIADPANRTPEAQEKRKRGYSNPRSYLRENELAFGLAEGLGVYANEFSEAVHVISNYQPDPRSPLYRGWDSSYNGQACGFYQYNHAGQLVWFDQVIMKAVPLQRVIQEVLRRSARWMATDAAMRIGLDGMIGAGETVVEDYGDPALEAHNAQGETVTMTLSRYGIRLRSKVTTGRKVDLVEQPRQLLLPRSDGRPALIIARNSAEMDHVVAGFQGGYRYDKPKEGKAEKEVPLKDGLYDHIFDQLQYMIDNISPVQYATHSDDPDPDWWRAGIEEGIGQGAGD